MSTTDSLEECYSMLVVDGFLEPDVMQRLWQRWLWDTPCNHPLLDTCGDMNLNQGVGLLLCVALSHSWKSTDADIAHLLPHSPLVHLTIGPLNCLTQRQLLDQLECLQLNWGSVMGSHEDMEGNCQHVLEGIMARLGTLMSHAYTSGSTELDCIQYTAVLPTPAPLAELYIVSRKYLRRMCCLCLVLFRTLYITSAAVVAEVPADNVLSPIRSAFQVWSPTDSHHSVLFWSIHVGRHVLSLFCCGIGRNTTWNVRQISFHYCSKWCI